jgi:hypothetical protein
MAGTQKRKWALETNVVLDLSRKVDAALSLWEISIKRGYSLDQVNDGAILAEASLGNATLLVSSDSHLTSIHPGHLVMDF